MVKSNNISTASANYSYIDSFGNVSHQGDTVEIMTVLGQHLANPYLIPNITQAYHNLGVYNVTIGVTNKYVRFKPTLAQFKYLDSLMDVQSIELFDIPLDYQILMEGDYYQDPSIPTEEPTWQYAVVPANFSFPAGIQYETLAQIHIPEDDYTAVETEAERLAEASAQLLSLNGGAVTNSEPAGGCPEGTTWNPVTRSCEPVVLYPPSPAPDAAVPAGAITVDETQQLAGLAASTTNSGTYRLAPVRKARVVARRWFKVERTYTDNSGHFQFSKRFKHKVRINIKFKNDDAVIRNLRGARVWNTLSPLNKVIGVFSGNKSNITYNFAQYSDKKALGNEYWVGGTVHNAVQEYKDFATAQGIGQPQSNLSILITSWTSNGSTPMLEKLAIDNLPQQFIVAFVANVPTAIMGGVAVLQSIVGHNTDMTIGYNWVSGSFFNFKSDDLKETAYHELTHAGHYVKCGKTWYTQFVNAEISGIVNNVFNTAYSPYGNGSASYSPIIALGESWAYHMGHIMADLRYGLQSSQPQSEQGVNFNNGATSSHINVLEGFNPNLTTDPFRWIPKGLYQDLKDVTNESSPVNDQVSNYTNQQMFNAFSSSITTLQAYRANLLSQNGNSQSTQVVSLFSLYNY